MSSTYIDYHPKGAAQDLFACHAPEVILSGPAGTGKSRAGLEKVHLCLLKYAGAKALAVRKTLVSLTATGIDTYLNKVQPTRDGVVFFGGSKQKPAQFQYPNTSRLELGGLDSTDAIQKVMSGEYDLIYAQEAVDLTEHDWETLSTRLRNGVMPYQQLLGDTNPQSPIHWIKRRADRGDLLMLESRHEDNPRLWNGTDWTDEGRYYIAVLDKLSGVRKERLRYGRWAAAEGLVYDAFDRKVHIIDAFPIPETWRRFRSIDFGWNNPFVCQWWAIDPDGRIYLYREIYRSNRLVSDHANDILALTAGERIEATVADHDAEDRATLHAAGINTQPANKTISTGIQAVQDRLMIEGDGKPRLYVMRDALVSRDDRLSDAGKPYSTEHEFDGYIWPKGIDGKALKEVPVGVDDHGLDAARYATMYVTDTGLPYQYLLNDPAYRHSVLGDDTPLTDEERVAKRIADFHAAHQH